MRCKIIQYWIVYFLVNLNLILVCFSNSNLSGQLEDRNYYQLSIESQTQSAAKIFPVSGSPIGNEPVTFTNVSSTSNLSGFRSDSFAWGDYNNDGYLDFITRGNLSIGTRLFRNNGPPSWNFTDVSNDFNLSGTSKYPNRGYPIWGDYDNDGNLDFFMAGDHDQLWRNNGPPGWNFSNVTSAAGNLNDGRPSEAAGWGDYDRDGYLDLYVVSWRDANNVKFNDVLWHNNGNGTFTDVSTLAGIYSSNSNAYDPPPFAGMGVAWGDYNNDGWSDIYVCNYLVTPNYLFRNNHDGTFTEIALTQGVAGNPDRYFYGGPYYGHTAGAGWADFNNNGDLDLWISNLAHKDSEDYGGGGRGYYCDDSMMYLNEGGPFFEFKDIRNRTGIPIIPVGTIQNSQWKDEDFFGVTWGDYDNDCDIDLWVPQVKTYHSWAHSYLWQNNNNETFTDTSDNVGIKIWSNTGAVWGDYNNDGFLDLLTEGTYPYQGKRETRLFKNNGNSNNWLQLRLKGIVSNSAAIGARLSMTCGELTQTREIGGDAGGHGFQNSFQVEFGLGTYSKADEVKIIWPSGIVQVLKNIAANQILNISEPAPGPKITSLSVTKYIANEDEVLTFSGTAQGSPATYEWDFDNDGVIDWQSTSAPPQAQFIFNRSGNYTAKLLVWDSSKTLGWSETTDFILVQNVAPIADAGDDITVFEDEIIVFNSSLSIDTPSDIDTLEFNWTFESGVYSNWTSSPEINYNYTYNGIYDVTLQVRDDDFSIHIDTIQINVLNKPPTCEIIVNTSAPEDTEVQFKVNGLDTPSDMQFLRYIWDFGDGESSEWTFENEISHRYKFNGTYNVVCEVQDDDGYADQSSDEVELIIYNLKPQCIVIDDRLGNEDQNIVFEGYGVDTPSDRFLLEYLWDFDDGTTTEWLYSGSQNITHIYTKKGEYKAKLIVKDDDGAVCTGIVNVTIANIPPTCEVQDLSFWINEDNFVELNGTGSDTESDLEILQYSWKLGVDGVPNSPWSIHPGFKYWYRSSGIYTAILSVKDDDGDTANASIEITVTNVPPTAKFTVNKTEIFEDDSVLFDASMSTDSESDLDTLDYLWEYGEFGSSMGKYLIYTFHKKGEYIIKLNVIDDDGSLNSYSKKIKVKNVRPIPVITVSTTDATIGHIITFNGYNSIDTESDIESLNYTWSFGDKIKAYGGIVTHKYDDAGIFKVKLTVTDDDSAEETVELYVNITEAEKRSPSDSSETDQSSINLTLGGISILILILILLLFLYFQDSSKLKFEDLSKEPSIDVDDQEKEIQNESEQQEDIEIRPEPDDKELNEEKT